MKDLLHTAVKAVIAETHAGTQFNLISFQTAIDRASGLAVARATFESPFVIWDTPDEEEFNPEIEYSARRFEVVVNVLDARAWTRDSDGLRILYTPPTAETPSGGPE